MTKPSPLTDDQLKALAMQELRGAVGYFGGKLADQRRKAEIYYLGEAKDDLAPPEIDGRSSVVSTDVRNTIESMLPQLMGKFVGGDQVVEFEPATKDDEQKAQQCTDYLNYLFLKKNNGHKVCYSWFKDALLQKNGIIKVWWDTRTEEKREEYKGLTLVELTEILEDPEVEPIEQTKYPDEEDAKHREEAVQHLTQQLQQAMQAAQQPPQGPQGMPQQGNPQAMQAVQHIQQQLAQIESQPPAMLYDVSFKRSKKGGKLAIENVPPEEFLISREAKSIATARMTGHRVPRTLSELRSMGYPASKIDMIGSDDAAASLNAERLERLGYDDEFASLGVQDNPGDDSQRVVWLNELYLRCDYDGDGISELRKVCIAGNQLLDNEEVDISPFISITPVPMPHKFFGLSIADLSMESQKTKTQMLRSQLDNLYLEVNGRYFAVDGQVNLDDLLTSRPGSVVRMKQPGMAGRLDQGKGNIGEVSNLMEYMEMDLEQRTGWTRYSQGNDSKALNQTATGVQIITNKGDMRVDLIARNFGEGFRELFEMMLKLTAQHQDKKVQIRVAGQWVDMDPREWRNQFDVNINIGLGIGSKEEQVQKLMALSQQQAHVMAIGVASPKNVYNMMTDIAQKMGEKNPDKYFNDPEKNPPPQKGPPPEVQAKQMELQGQMQMAQQKAQSDAQSQQAQLAAQAQAKQAEIQANAQLESVKAQYQVQADEANRAHEAQLEQLKMSMQAEVDRSRDESQAAQETLKMQQAAQLAQLEASYKDQQHAREWEMKWQIEQLKAATTIEAANIQAAVKVNDTATAAATAKETAALGGEKKLPMKEKPAPAPAPDHTARLADAVQKFADAADKMSKPRKTVVHRDANGKITHSTQE
jgi:hypothetical protein